MGVMMVLYRCDSKWSDEDWCDKVDAIKGLTVTTIVLASLALLAIIAQFFKPVSATLDIPVIALRLVC